MPTFLLFLVLEFTPRRAVAGFEVENQQLTFVERPLLDSTVTAYYQVVPRTTKDGVEVVFSDFHGVRPVGRDTIFCFNAREGQSRRFAVNIEYFSTPATFHVRIAGTHYGIRITRYLLDAKTGEYGSLKEIQYDPPLEYRFNPALRKFDEVVLMFEKDRWQRNRTTIERIKSIDAELQDSMCLLLNSDVYRTIFPSAITTYADKVTYLLESGWAKYTDEVGRVHFLNKLRIDNETKNENERKKLGAELADASKAEFRRWLWNWLAPASVLFVLLIMLLVLRGKIQSPLITSHRTDIFLCYAVYVIIVSLAVYFAWPYLSIHEFRTRRLPDKHLLKSRDVFHEVRKSNILENFSDFDIISRSTFWTESGLGAEYIFRSRKHSAFGIEYRFTAVVWPDSDGYQLRRPTLLPIEAIEQFEKNAEVAAYLKRNRVRKAQIVFGTSHFLIVVRDTLTMHGIGIPLSLDYDGSRDVITNCTLPPHFEDEAFPEISMLSNLLARWGYAIKEGTFLTRLKRNSKAEAQLTAVIDVERDDTLNIIMQRENYFKYWWSPVPNVISTPQPILDQIFVELSKAGLSLEYVRDNVKLVSVRSFRRPNYFTYDKRDRVIMEAVFKWYTNCSWVDTFNCGEGVRFTTVYEYSYKSMKLGRPLGKPATRGIQQVWKEITPRYYSMRPIGRIISREEARAKIFDALPDESGFNSMYIRLNIPERSEKQSHFLCLVGQYESHEIMVDLETGAILGPQVRREWCWTEYEMPEAHSYPYD